MFRTKTDTWGKTYSHTLNCDPDGHGGGVGVVNHRIRVNVSIRVRVGDSSRA